ncbi:MAG: succinate dehydrogenase cytochrome b subunit [Gemmataceae bacterium]|nr:succinate dehydrogenase cytochrome b subunit [Gemmataceae bacterium]
MKGLIDIPRSSLGCKFLMGVTGFLLMVFVFGHMTGNLLIFLGPDAINEYGEFLQGAGHGLLIWAARLGLLAIFITHLAMALLLRKRNKEARPVPYDGDTTLVASWVSRHMMLSGLVILAFVLYHLAHFTVGITDSANFKMNLLRDAMNRPDIYTMVVRGFQQPMISAIYMFAQLILGLHLYHGAGSWIQSLGLARGWVRNWLDPIGWAVLLLVFLGNCSIPFSILAGWVK